MDKTQDWITAFQISDQQMSEWKAQAPAGQSILFYSLMQNKLDEKTYQQWASNHFQIPSIQAEFFNTPANLKMWEKVRSDQQWTMEFFPILEWDGVIFIGCLHPHTENFEWPKKHSFLIAPATGLSKWWQEFHQLSKASSSVEKEIEQEINFSPPAKSSKIDFGNLEMPGTEASAPALNIEDPQSQNDSDNSDLPALDFGPATT